MVELRHLQETGINEPCYILLNGGNTSTELEAIERHLRSELQSHNPRYDDLQDAVAKSLRLPWWRGRGSVITYAPFVLIWCPENPYCLISKAH